NINNQGGIDGRVVQGVELDTQLGTLGTDAGMVKATQEMMLQSVVDMGAIGVIGPAASGEVTNMYPVATTDNVVLMSPSSTAPQRPATWVMDNGYMFRDAPDDNIQGIATAYYLRTQLTPPQDKISILYEDTVYGSGLKDSLRTQFANQGGTVDNPD